MRWDLSWDGGLPLNADFWRFVRRSICFEKSGDALHRDPWTLQDYNGKESFRYDKWSQIDTFKDSYW